MIRDLKPYPAYKDSGMPWLGDVPEGWGVLQSAQRSEGAAHEANDSERE